MKCLLNGLKTMPKTFELTVASIDEGGYVLRHTPTVYTRDDDYEGDTYYLNSEGKDVFFFSSTPFGIVAQCLDCDTRNLDYPQDFISCIKMICDSYIPFSKSISTEEVLGGKITK